MISKAGKGHEQVMSKIDEPESDREVKSNAARSVEAPGESQKCMWILDQIPNDDFINSCSGLRSFGKPCCQRVKLL